MTATPTGAIPLSGNILIDGLLQGGAWEFTGSRTLTYSFHSETSTTWTASNMSAVSQALSAWSAVANISFTAKNVGGYFENSTADMAFTFFGYGGDILAFAFFPDPAVVDTYMDDYVGYDRSFYPNPEGDVFIYEDHIGFNSVAQGYLGFSTLLHEIGHAIGLKHPHDGGGNGNPLLTGQYDDGLWTVMSYNDPQVSPTSRGYQATPMPLDILAIQAIYGANTTYRTENNTYSLTKDGIVKTIWDAGGTDTIDASALTIGTIISLEEGSFIDHGDNYSITAIAFDVVIENAKGTGYADTLIGNAANNVLNGGAGIDDFTGGAGNDTYILDRQEELLRLYESASSDVDTLHYYYSHTNPVAKTLDLTSGSLENIENVTIFGTGLFNVVGNDADNTLIGNASRNTLTGGLGNDTLDGKGGADTMIGGDGDDVYFADNADDVITENINQGTDTVNVQVAAGITYIMSANIENGILLGSAANNLTGNSGVNTLTGNTGANVLDGGAGADTMIGGAGNDTYVVDDAGDVLIDSAGVDTVRVSANYTLATGFENLTLLVGGLTATGNAANNVLTGSAGDDRLDGAAGNDTLNGGLGNDTYVIDSALDIVTDTGGIDTIEIGTTYTLGAAFENLLLTGSANINGTGNALANLITGNAGNNTLSGAAGVDTLIGGAGNDTYIMSDSVDTIIELSSEGTDTVQSSASYALSANIENLVLTGNAAINGTGSADVNVITGNAAANTLDGGAGADTLTGGAGNDTYVIDNAGDVIVETSTLATEIDTVVSSISFTLTATLENLVLSGSGAIDGTGNARNNTITGNGAANMLAGGLGNDTYIVSSATEVITEVAGQGTDTILSSAALYIMSENIENMTLTGTGNIWGTGNSANNIITGNAGNNLLSGGGGIDTLIGGAGNDTYSVDTLTDVINDVSGNDTVEASLNYTLGGTIENLTLTGLANLNGVGNTLVNVLTGNSGNNTLNGGTGADTMIGGDGNDTYIVDNVADVIVELNGEGTQDTVQTSMSYVLSANIENLVLTGKALNGTGNADVNIITGNALNNTLDGGIGADTLNGGAGNDTYVLDDLGDVMIDTAGVDTVSTNFNYTLLTGFENLTLRVGGLTGTGNALANVMTGSAGDDRLDGGLGKDNMIGGAGNDTYVVDMVGDIVTDTGGTNDTVESAITYTLGATIENLLLTGVANLNGTGNALANILTGNAGNNTLSGAAGADTMIGGAGSDLYIVDNVGDVVTELASADVDRVQSSASFTLSANVEHLTLTGTAAIHATGNADANSLVGNAAANTLDGGLGADTMVGGAGADTYVVDEAGDVVVETSTSATEIDTVRSNINYTLGTNLNNLVLTGVTALVGVGNGLNNFITGNGNDNTLTGGLGNDTLDGGIGADTLDGGAGNDTYIIGLGDVLIDSAGIDTVHSTVSHTLASNFENLTLLTGGLTGTGNSLANILTGSAGDDRLDGGLGKDTMIGGLGNDTYVVDMAGEKVTDTGGTDTVESFVTYTLGATIENLELQGAAAIHGTGNGLANSLTGNAGANTLSGGAGNDWISGLDGADVLVGGAGIDTFVFDNTNAIDVIKDFSRTQGDKIDIGDLLTAYDDLTDTLSDFVHITLTAGVNVLSVDRDGPGVGFGFQDVVRITGLTGVIDVDNPATNFLITG